MAIVVEHKGALVAAGAFGLYRPRGPVGPTFARWLGDHRQWFSPELLVDPEMPAAGDSVVDALLGLADVVHLPAATHGAGLRRLEGEGSVADRASGSGGLDCAGPVATHGKSADEVQARLPTRSAPRGGGHAAARLIAR